MNFLLFEDKIKVKKEYKSRIVIIFGVFFFFAILAGAVLLWPIFISLEGQQKSAESQLEFLRQKNSTEEMESVVAFVKDTQDKISFLNSIEKDRREKSEDIKGVLSKKPKEITINNFSFNQKRFVLSGFSKSRESLLSFVESLKLDESFKKVEFPVSNLLKENDIDFVINIDL